MLSIRRKLGSVRLLFTRLRAPFRSGGIARSIRAYAVFLQQRRSFTGLGGQAPFRSTFPQLFDATAEHEFDTHYFFQAAWAARCIKRHWPEVHFDIGSDNRFVATLSGFVATVWVDVRPLAIDLDGLTSIASDLMDLEIEDSSVESLSCLSVLEHVGLGRYGDKLDPSGMRSGAQELSRILAPGGHLYLSVPVGRDRVEFNAHRVSDPEDVMKMFPNLKLASFSFVDGYMFRENVAVAAFDPAVTANGLFHFVKEPGSP